MAADDLKAFISYSHKDRRLARHIKDCLVSFGVDVFLAHEDIEPSAEWAREIKERLLTCHVFLPLLTRAFPQSQWTDQETGMAVAAEKLIVPLKVDWDPYGFIGAIQALKVDPDNPAEPCQRIIRTIAKHPTCRERFLDRLIRMFSQSGTFEAAGSYAGYLLDFEGYSPQQLRRVLLAAIENDQIHNSFKARRRLSEFVEIYKRDIDPALVKKAKAAMGD